MFLLCVVLFSPTAHDFFAWFGRWLPDSSDSCLPILYATRQNSFSFSPRWTKSRGRTWSDPAWGMEVRAGPVAMAGDTVVLTTGWVCITCPTTYMLLCWPTLNAEQHIHRRRGCWKKIVTAHFHSEYEILCVEEFILLNFYWGHMTESQEKKLSILIFNLYFLNLIVVNNPRRIFSPIKGSFVRMFSTWKPVELEDPLLWERGRWLLPGVVPVSVPYVPIFIST